MKKHGQGDNAIYIPESVDELFKNGNATYYINDPDLSGDNVYAMKLFIDMVEIPDEMIKLNDGTQIFVSDGKTTLQVDSGGLGNFHLHGYDVTVVNNDFLKEHKNMNLSAMAKKILREDTWGNNPSAAGSMSPGRSPTTTPPPASTNMKFHDLKKDYDAFTNSLEKQEEAAKKKLDADLSQKIGNKKVTVRASKGSVGQVEKDYTFVVASVDVVYLKDKYYIVFASADEDEYYVNTEFKVKIDGTAPEAPTMAQKPAGNVVSQPVIGAAAKGNIQGT